MRIDEAVKYRRWTIALAGPASVLAASAVLAASGDTAHYSAGLRFAAAAVATWLAGFGVMTGIFCRNNRILYFGLWFGLGAGVLTWALARAYDVGGVALAIFTVGPLFSMGLFWSGGLPQYVSRGVASGILGIVTYFLGFIGMLVVVAPFAHLAPGWLEIVGLGFVFTLPAYPAALVFFAIAVASLPLKFLEGAGDP